jgi:peroxiredoxin
MNNLTGAYDVAVEVSLDALNRVLAVLHENQDRRFPVLPHSMRIFVDDTPRGEGDPVPETERTGFQAEVEVQVSTPTLSLPQDGSVVEGVAMATARGLGQPWLPRPSDVIINAAVRAWVKGSPQPAVPEFLHGDVIVRADIVRTTVGLVGQTPVGFLPPSGIGGGSTLPLTPETFLGLARTSVGVAFRPAPGTAVSGEERLRIERIIRNVLRGNMQPVTFQVSVPEDVNHWDYKLDPDHASAMAAFVLTGTTPPVASIEDLSGGWISPGADFAIALGRDYLLPLLKAQILRGLPDEYGFSWGWFDAVSAEIRPDWAAAGFNLEPGRIVLSLTGAGYISYAGIHDNFSFTIRMGLTLAAVGGALELRAAGDPEVDLSDVAVFEGTLEGRVRDRLREERDRALEAAGDRIRGVLQVQRLVDEILARIQPNPPSVTLTGVAIRREGVTVSATTSLAPATPVVVRQVKRGRMIDALDSWIPGGTIESFRWYQRPPVLASVMLVGPETPSSGDGLEEHQFVAEEDLLGHAHAIAAVRCLEVQGRRVTPSGAISPISGHTCGFYHPLLPWLVTGFPQSAARPWPVLPIQGLRPDGKIGVVGNYSPWASGRAPRDGATSLVVHFAEGDWQQTAAALQEALWTHSREAALVVAILFPEGALSELAQARIETGAALLLGEDIDGHWSEAYGVDRRPATVLVNSEGRIAWRQKGTLNPASLADALQEYAERGGRVSWQPLGLGVAAGDTPPDFPFQMGRGAEISLRRLRGRRLAVSFWTSWSEPSIAQLREFSHAYKARGDAGPIVLAVGDGESADRSAEMAHAENLPFPVLPDPGRKISRRFGVGCWPSTAWIGTTMRVEAVNFGLTAVAEPTDGVPSL